MDWWGFLMKKLAVYLMLIVCLLFVLCGCKSDKDNEENSDGFTIEEEMIFEDENEDEDSGKPYDKDDDGFVDGWY